MADTKDNDNTATFPKTDYFGKATDLVVGYDRLMVSLYTSLVAGVIVLLLSQKVGAWTGAFFLIALVFFIFGVAHTLLHMIFHAKMLLAMEAMIRKTDYVPNAVEDEEPSGRAYLRMQDRAQRAYGGQLYYLLAGIASGGLAVILHLWLYAWRAAVIVGVLAGLLAATAIAVKVWRKTIRRKAKAAEA